MLSCLMLSCLLFTLLLTISVSICNQQLQQCTGVSLVLVNVTT